MSALLIDAEDPGWPARSPARSQRPPKALSPDRRMLVVVLFAAAAVRLIWTIVAAPPPESDFLTFFSTAQLIGQGYWWPDAYGWAWQGPAYPLLMAPLTLLGQASLPAIYAMNVALGVLTVALVYRLGSSLFGSRAGLLAAAIAAALPGLWLWTPIVSAENLSAPIFVGIAALMVERATKWQLPLLGVLTGMLVFVRPSTLFFFVVVLLSVIWLAPFGSKRRSALVFAAGVAVSVGLFATLNLRAGGPGLPVGGSGWQPWLVYNERATGAWFPAQDRDDYPFHGLEDDPTLSSIVRAAQLKLALQFALLNPGEIVPSIIQRHVNNWQSDEAGLDWTVRRPGASPVASNLSPALDVLVDRYYVAVLGLALLGAGRLAGRPAVVVVLLLPLAYLVAPAVIAEGNARYHVNGLAFLATLAGGALAGGALASRSMRAGLLALGTVAVVLWAPPGVLLAPWLVAGILCVGAARLIFDVRPRIRTMMAAGAPRRRVLLGLAAGVVAAQLALAVALLAARQVVIDWSLTQPAGWTSYRSGSALRLGGDAIALRASDVPARFRKVSFPDAVVLTYPSSAQPGERMGLTRTFPDLEVGTKYVIYLQLFDPAPSAGGDRLTVRLNGRVVWEPPDASASEAGWQDIIVPWTADSPFVSVQIERSADAPLAASEVLIRSVHVYPKY